MNLIIDIGNTLVKTVVFKDGQLVHLESTQNPDIDLLPVILKKFPAIKNAIVSSVRQYPEQLLVQLKKICNNTFVLNSSLPIPLENLYESKNTLGYDRLAACIGAHKRYPKNNLLVIDAGTAITFDFVNNKGQYLGGCISPGFNMRFGSLNMLTQNLPLLSINEHFSLIGKNTNDAIVSGVQNGVIFETDTYINNLSSQYKSLQVILTGGDAPFIHRNIKNRSALHANILVEGLNCILEYNLG